MTYGSDSPHGNQVVVQALFTIARLETTGMQKQTLCAALFPFYEAQQVDNLIHEILDYLTLSVVG